MTLGELINKLGRVDAETEMHYCFCNPHSYRGSYDCLAFEPCLNTTVGQMLDVAKESCGKTYDGYKGGNFFMDEDVYVYIAHHGCCGEELTNQILGAMIMS